MKKMFLIATLFLFANIANAQLLKNYVTYSSNVQMIWTLDELQNYFGDYAGYDSTTQTWKYKLSLTAFTGSTLYRIQYGLDTTNGITNVNYYDIISTTTMTPIKTVSAIPIIYDTQGRASIRVYSATDSPATYCFRQIRIW